MTSNLWVVSYGWFLFLMFCGFGYRGIIHIWISMFYANINDIIKKFYFYLFLSNVQIYSWILYVDLLSRDFVKFIFKFCLFLWVFNVLNYIICISCGFTHSFQVFMIFLYFLVLISLPRNSNKMLIRTDAVISDLLLISGEKLLIFPH